MSGEKTATRDTNDFQGVLQWKKFKKLRIVKIQHLKIWFLLVYFQKFKI